MTGARIAVVYARDDAVLGGGTDTRVDALLDGIRVHANVDLCLLPTSDRDPPRRLRAALSGVPPRLAQQFDLGVAATLEPRLRAADAIVAATTFSLPYIPRALLGRTVLDAHNVESRVVEQLARHAPSAVRRLAYRASLDWTRAWERRAARRLGQVWAVSEAEAAWFREAGAWDVVVVPNGVNLPAHVPTPGADVVLVASFESVFNLQGLRWFLSEVWPLVLSSVPGTRLVLAGRGSEALGGQAVDGLGYVEDLAPVYGRARLAIAPLRSGAGTRLKVLEGLAYGVPVVTTSLGAEGLELQGGRDYLEADEPEQFARCCVELLRDDLRHGQIREHGLAAVRGRYDWTAIGASAREGLERLVATSEASGTKRPDGLEEQ